MKVKTSELQGTALDWAVAKCAGILERTILEQVNGVWAVAIPDLECGFEPSTCWSQGGPIIEREGIGSWMYQWNEQGEPEAGWYAEDRDGDHVRTGPTPLIAAMRCYVASKLGEEIEIPEGLK
jgi:hypothetical protein